ncbi:MAG: histidine kinase [Rhizobiaceae bacterium]|nr:histidine kinase [Rhizobiaceae bacterium]
MPSLIRFIIVCGVLGGLVYAGMFALATFVEPEEREIRVKIPSKRINQ